MKKFYFNSIIILLSLVMSFIIGTVFFAGQKKYQPTKVEFIKKDKPNKQKGVTCLLLWSKKTKDTKVQIYNDCIYNGKYILVVQTKVQRKEEIDETAEIVIKIIKEFMSTNDRREGTIVPLLVHKNSRKDKNSLSILLVYSLSIIKSHSTKPQQTFI